MIMHEILPYGFNSLQMCINATTNWIIFSDIRKCKYLAFETQAVDILYLIYIPDMGNLLIYISNMNVGPWNAKKKI